MPTGPVLSQLEQFLTLTNKRETVISSNMANVNTPGYSRELVNLSSAASASDGSSQDGGVSLGGFTSVRDEILQIGINQKTSDAGSLSTQSAAWSSIESGFSGTGNDLGSALSTFFSNLSSLSTSPNNTVLRETVFSAAGQLVDAFHQASSTLSAAEADANSSVPGIVQQVNELSSQIAQLDAQVTALQGSGQDGGPIEDQRDELTTQLAKLIGVSSTNTDSTPTLTSSNGSPLVIGGQAYALQSTLGADGAQHVLDAQGQDITESLTGGSLGGAIIMRDQSARQISTTLDQLAYQFASAMNAAQVSGYDQNGAQGQPMFNVPSGSSGSAAGISLAMNDPSAIAASSDGSAGSSGNLSNLLAVQTDDLPSGQPPSDTYAGLTESVGSASASVTSNLNATNAALAQLTAQQGSESGVSVDEETTNLLRYQQAYSAAAQVITTVNNLFSVLMNMSTVTS